MSKNPHVSIVMSVYNGASYLREALDSIFAQTLKSFELIVVNDGSTDDTAKILASYTDKRLRVFTQINKGLVASLNFGIGQADSPIIARHDADDRSDPTRLEKELALLKARSRVAIVGSSMAVMDMESKQKHVHSVLLNNAELKQELLLRSPFAHGSVMFRKQAFIEAGGYLQDEWPAEDYGLWLRMAPQGDFTNIDEPLYTYRENDHGISSLNTTSQNTMAKQLQNAAWNKRYKLFTKRIDTDSYKNITMGQQRVERITYNLLYAIRRASSRFDLLTVTNSLYILLADRGLRRKTTRAVMIKLGLTHG